MNEQILDRWGGSSDSDSGDEHDSIIAKSKPFFGRKVSIRTLLGGGKVAYILLRRNKRLSAEILSGVIATWPIYHSMGFHLLSLIGQFLMAVLTESFVWSKVPARFNKSLPEIPEISLPEYVFLDAADMLNYVMNKAIKIFRSVAMGKDSTEFLVVTTFLWMVAVVGSWFDLLTLL